jgi:drug resistance transporter, EmrB/QacA subfamily
MASLLLSAMDSTVVSTSMKKIIESIGGMNKYSWPFTMYVLCSTLAIVICGGLADIYGHKPLIISGITIFLAGSMLCGMSQNIMQLIGCRGIQGIGGGIIVSCVFTIVADLFEPAERGKYTGIVTSVYGLSSIVGPLAGGFVTDHWGWRWVFYMNIPLGLIALGILIYAMPSFHSSGEKKTVDYAGIVSILLTLVPMLLSLSMGGNEFAWTSVPCIGMFACSVIMLFVFIAIEKKAKNPIMPLEFFSDLAITGSFMIAFLSQILMFGVIMYLPYFIQGIIGSTATTSGLVTVPMMLGLLVASNITGNLVSRFGKARFFSALAFVVMALGAYLLSTMNLKTTNLQAICFMIVLGFGVGMSMPIANVNAQNAAPRQQIGSVTSAVMFFRNMGGTVGSAILGAIMSNSLNNGFKNLDMQYLPATVRKLLINPQIISNANTIKGIRVHVPKLYINYFDKIYLQAKQVLANSIHDVFLFTVVIACVGFICAFILRDAVKGKTEFICQQKVEE